MAIRSIMAIRGRSRQFGCRSWQFGVDHGNPVNHDNPGIAIMGMIIRIATVNPG
ncbi:hypothetical protein [Larkinella punicea]|uniref:hypothetical protein n=1 Tax=Larkinella punicea TaxID=2315727 RepID=UPI0014028595|nr:hypothetical protein [Larkinella punicea]